jgi:hypothetical protein
LKQLYTIISLLLFFSSFHFISFRFISFWIVFFCFVLFCFISSILHHRLYFIIWFLQNNLVIHWSNWLFRLLLHKYYLIYFLCTIYDRDVNFEWLSLIYWGRSETLMFDSWFIIHDSWVMIHESWSVICHLSFAICHLWFIIYNMHSVFYILYSIFYILYSIFWNLLFKEIFNNLQSSTRELFLLQNLFKYFQTCSNMFKYVQICLIRLKYVQSCLVMFNSFQISPNMLKSAIRK